MGRLLRHKTDSGAEYCTMQDDPAEEMKEVSKYKSPPWKGLHFDDEVPLSKYKIFSAEDIPKGTPVQIIGVTSGGYLIGRKNEV